MSNPPIVPPVPPVPPTPTPTPTPASGFAVVEADIDSDVAAIKTDAASVAIQARAEYDALSAGAQARIHQLLNDLETAESTSLAGMHTLFGAKT